MQLNNVLSRFCFRIKVINIFLYDVAKCSKLRELGYNVCHSNTWTGNIKKLDQVTTLLSVCDGKCIEGHYNEHLRSYA